MLYNNHGTVSIAQLINLKGYFMRFLCFFIFTLLLSACGEGDSSDHNISSPQSELLHLNGHTLNDIIKLSNNSLWLIVGVSADSGSLGSGEKDVIIYDTPNDFGEPDQGIRGQYYVFINNSSDSFYIDVIPTPNILKKGTAELGILSLGDIAVLDDNTVWKVEGVNGSSVSSNSNFFTYTLYDVDETFSDLINQTTDASGEITTWYLFNENVPSGYYLAPIVDADIIWQGTHTFHAEGINDSILLSDGSLWLITGDLSSSISTAGEYTIMLIQKMGPLGEPGFGYKTETIMYIQGLKSIFYIEEI